MVITRHFTWYFDGQRITAPYDERGAGQAVVLLPAPSAVYTRGEPAGIDQLAQPEPDSIPRPAHHMVRILPWR